MGDARRLRAWLAPLLAVCLLAACGRSRRSAELDPAAGAPSFAESGDLPERPSPFQRYVAVGTRTGVSVVDFDELLAPVTTPLTPRGFTTIAPAWSPNGDFLAYGEFSDSALWMIHTARAPDFSERTLVADFLPESHAAPWVYWLGDAHLLVAFPQTDTRRPPATEPWFYGSLYVVDLANRDATTPVALGFFDSLSIASNGAGALASTAVASLFIAADGRTETLAVGSGHAVLSGDGSHLLAHATAWVPAVTARTVAVDNIQLESGDASRVELTGAEYARGQWSLDLRLAYPSGNTRRFLHLVPSAPATVLEAAGGIELPDEWGKGWGFTAAGDRFAALSRCEPTGECTWTLGISGHEGALVADAPGLARDAGLSGDEQFVYVSALDTRDSTYALYGAPLDSTDAQLVEPVVVARGALAVTPVQARPGGTELLFGWEDPAERCAGAASDCESASYALRLDGPTGETMELPGILGPQWAPDGVGFVAERAGTLVYVPARQADHVYELAPAEASYVYVPPTWPPSERPR